VRTARETWGESWILDYRRLDDRRFLESRLTSEYGDVIWGRVAKARPSAPAGKPRPHSYHIIVIDSKGNAITGSNSYQQSLPWGPGIFVEGVFLPDIRISLAYPEEVPPSTRRVNALTMHLVFDRGSRSLRFATGSIGDSIVEACFQWLVNLMDYRMSAAGAVSTPVFGTFPHDVHLANVDWNSNWLNPGIDPGIVALLEKRGMKFQQKGPLVGTGLDSGLGAVAVVRPRGAVEGSLAPWPGLTDSQPVPPRGP
jgi:gamma-glutamyltranspeptidase